VSRRFNVEIQPQLVMLQKTLLNIEGLGRQLDPELDLWKTAKPFLERWMSEQMGWRALRRKLVEEAPGWALTMPELPRLAHRVLSQAAAHDALHDPIIIERRSRRQLRWLRILSALVVWRSGASPPACREKRPKRRPQVSARTVVSDPSCREITTMKTTTVDTHHGCTASHREGAR